MRFDELEVDTDFAAAVAVELAKVEAECREQGFKITTDRAVDQHAAAALVDRSYGRLRNWRLPSCTLPMAERLIGRKRGGKVSYALAEIAGWRVRNTTW